MKAVTFTAENISGLYMTGFSPVDSYTPRASELLSELKDGETLTLAVSYETAKELVRVYSCKGCMAAHIAAKAAEKDIPLDMDHAEALKDASERKIWSGELACISGEAYIK